MDFSLDHRVSLLAVSCLSLGCAQEPSSSGVPQTSDDLFGTPSSVLSEQPATSEVTGLCQITQSPQTEFTPLDLATFTQTLADLSVGWMTPLHEALLGLNEPRLLETMVETVGGTFATTCQPEPDYEFIPPGDELTDPQNQADFRQSIVDFFEGATVHESGERLRFSIYQCPTCSEPLGTEPLFITARLTQAGLLIIDVELTEGSVFTRNLTVGPDVLAHQTQLAALSDWGQTASDAIRSGQTVMPEGKGTVTVGARRAGPGTLNWWLGVSGMEIVAERGGTDEVTWRSTEDCLGVEVKLGPTSTGSTAGLNAGPLDMFMTGQSHCPEGSACGEKERSGPWHYHLGGLAGILSQPPQGSGSDLGLLLRMPSEGTAAVAGDVFARGGLGPAGTGGEVELTSGEQAEGYVVTFEPALDMGGALTISQFSDDLRLDLPSWLSDEIFDLSFGGTPTSSILVPKRERCPEDRTEFVPPARREVRILSGGGQMAVGGGRVLEAQAGQCVGRSLTDSTTYTRVSDFWEAGFSCSP